MLREGPLRGCECGPTALAREARERGRGLGGGPDAGALARLPASRHERCWPDPSKCSARPCLRPCATATDRGGRHRTRVRPRRKLARDRGVFLSRPGLLHRAPGGAWPAGRVADAPGALAARLCFRGALAATALASSTTWANAAPASGPSLKGSGSGAMADQGAGLLALLRSSGDVPIALGYFAFTRGPRLPVRLEAAARA
jgi:hypothetical protein